MSAGVVATWFMVPFSASRGDSLAWVSLTGPVYAGIVISGAGELAARLGSRPFAWAIPVVLFATSQRTGVMASSFSDADLALAAVLFGSLAFAIPRSVDEERPRDRDRRLVRGVAHGVRRRCQGERGASRGHRPARDGPEARRRAATRIVPAFAVSWIVMAGYWYARKRRAHRQSRLSSRVPLSAGHDVSAHDASRVRAALRRGAHGGRRRIRLSQLAEAPRRARRHRPRRPGGLAGERPCEDAKRALVRARDTGDRRRHARASAQSRRFRLATR